MKRHLPITQASLFKDRIDIARIQPGRDMGIMLEKGSYHPQLYHDVKEMNQTATMKTNRVLTKYENKRPALNDIAIYNTRSQLVDDNENVGLNYLQMENAKEKVKQKYHTTISKPSVKSPLTSSSLMEPLTSRTSTASSAFSSLMDNSLIPTSSLLVDDRMNQHTSDRRYMLPSDRQQWALSLQPNNNPDIIERNRRQKEADDFFLRRNKKNRWVEDRMSYNKRANSSAYAVEEMKRTAKVLPSSERITLNVVDEPTTAFGDFTPYHQREKESFEITNVRKMEPSGFIESTIDGVVTFFSSLFNRKKSKDDEKTIGATFTDEIQNEFIGTDEQFKTKERMLYKPDHVYIMKTGEIISEFPEESNQSAIAYQTMNVTGNVRTNVILDRYGQGDGKIVVMQRRAEDSIFINDGKSVGDDFIGVVIPIEHIDKKVRERIIKNNLDNSRNQPLSLEYGDFVQFNDFLEKHPEQQIRIKKHSIISNLRTGDISEFEEGSTFVDHKVYNALAENKRTKLTNNRTRVNVNVDYEDRADPMVVTQTPERKADLKKQNVRLTGVKKGIFDKH